MGSGMERRSYSFSNVVDCLVVECDEQSGGWVVGWSFCTGAFLNDEGCCYYRCCVAV